jgi:sugar lactone lactonase YvrE
MSSIALTPKPFSTNQGLYFGESPRYHAPSGNLYISDMLGLKIHAIPPDGTPHILCEVPNQPNGICFVDDETLIYSSMFDAKLYKRRLSDGHTSLYAGLSQFMTGYCGDMVIDAAGRVYVDDVGARVMHGQEPGPGRVIAVEPETGEVHVVADNIIFPNGIAIDSSGTSLFLAETFAYRLHRFNIDASTGALTDRQTVWESHAVSALTDKPVEKFCGIDGICLDGEDGMWLAMLGYECFIRRDAQGTITHRIDVKGHATACTLGGEEGKTLFLVVNEILEEGADLFVAMKGKRMRCGIWTVEVEVGRGEGRP